MHKFRGKCLTFPVLMGYIQNSELAITEQHQFSGANIGLEKLFRGRRGERLSCRAEKYIPEGKLTILPDKAQNLCHPVAKEDPVLSGHNYRRYEIGKLTYLYTALPL
jgi:hypothetical protein